MSKDLVVVMCSEYLFGFGAITENSEAEKDSMYNTILNSVGFESFEDYKSSYPKCIVDKFNKANVTMGMRGSLLSAISCVGPSSGLFGSTSQTRSRFEKEMIRLGDIPFGFMIGRVPTLEEMKEVYDFEDLDRTDVDMWYCDGWIETVMFNYDKK